MKKLLASLTVLFCLGAISVQSQLRDDTIKRVDVSGVGMCGTTSDWIWEVNKLANQAPAKGRSGGGAVSKTAAVFTTQPNFPVGKVITCGKFRLYYEDLLQSNNDGFAHSTLGAKRRQTLCAVLNYVQSVYDFNLIPTGDYIDLYVMWSYAPTNPAPSGTGFLAVAGPFFSPGSGYGNTAGFYGGNMFDHVTTGTDPQPGQYDGVLQVNFDKVTPSFQIASYWDDYTNTTSTCVWDLYSVLLHEVTHIMGWFSNVKEDTSTNNYYAENTLNNSFTLFDKYFLYYGDAKTPTTFAGNKLVTLGGSPVVNPNFVSPSSNTNPLRSNKVWMNNSGIPLNHPVYSGDYPLPAPYSPMSLLSHMSDTLNSFTGMSQYSPGFQPNYVMGPGIAIEQLKRQWTNFEMRTLLTIGYHLDPVFGSSTSLSVNGVVTNLNLLNTNIPPQRSTPAQVTEYYASNPLHNWAETMPVTATISTNNNTTSNPNATSVVINVSSLGTDANGDVVRILPGSLFNIRGCGNSTTGGGNNHNQLSINSGGTQVTYTPRPGFRGRAQFGFYLSDGKEQGSFCVATINVVSVGFVYIGGLPFNHNKVMNGDFENGTEVRQRLLNENIDHTGLEFYREGPFMTGDHLSDNQPSYNAMSNGWSDDGGEYIYQSWKMCNQVNGGLKGNYGRAYGDFNGNGYQQGTNPIGPLGNTATNPNHRYHNFAGSANFFELITPVLKCRAYRFEMDINLERTGLVVGNTFTATLNFVTNPGINPSAATTLQSAPMTLAVTTVAHNAWQHVSLDIPYCSPTAAMFVNLSSNVGGYPFHVPLIDNLALSEIAPPPLVVSASASPSSIPAGSCSTLAATATNATCPTTYTWQPGNLSGQSVTVCPGITTSYALTVNDSCRTATAATTVTVAGPCVDPPNSSMVAWYPFDETVGTTAANLATGNAGTLINSPTHISGAVAGALHFDGINDYVESPSTIVTNIGPAGLPLTCGGSYSTCRGDLSIDAWINVDPTASNGVITITDKRSGTIPAINGYQFFLYQRNKLGLQLADGAGLSGYTNYFSPVISGLIGNWHHVAVTVNRRLPAGIRWYADGVSVGSSDPTVTATRYGSLVNNSPMRIGADKGLGNWFKGDIDELEIFNRELTSAEVLGIFNAGASGKCK